MYSETIGAVARHIISSCFSSFRPIIVPALVVIQLLAGCSATDERGERNTSDTSHVNDAHLPRGRDLIEVDPYEFAEEHLVNSINEILPQLDVAPMPRAAQSGQFELRIWTNLGTFDDVKLLIISSGGSKNQAYFFDISRRSDPIQFRKVVLENPRASWNRMIFEVKSRLTIPKGLVRDPNFDLGRDEPVILLEVLDRGEYRSVFYRQNASFEDGIKLLDLCDYLGSEFDVNLACRRK